MYYSVVGIAGHRSGGVTSGIVWLGLTGTIPPVESLPVCLSARGFSGVEL